MSHAVEAPGVVGEINFRTGAAMLSRLGSEQLKDELTAVLELVKNAYDADAASVRVEIRESDEGQMIRIQDDGSGMTYDDLLGNWAWLATANKLRADRSPTFRRKRLGQKGVGRFATEKLGRKLLLRTRTTSGKVVLQVRFDWDELRGDRELSEYRYSVKEKKPDETEPSHGTRLDIRGLRVRWTKSRAEKLRSQLAQLIDPDATGTDFKIFLITPWQELNGLLQNPIADLDSHRLEFDIDSEGNQRVCITHDGKEENKRSTVPPPSFGRVHGRLRYFQQGLSSRERGKAGDPDTDWNMGIRIYRDGFRVRPYGEPGAEGDWLQIFRVRFAKGSRLKLNPNYLAGSIHISRDGNPTLRDTTSREGLEASDEYAALVEYAREKVFELSEVIGEEEAREQRKRAQERYRRTLGPVTAGLNTIRSEEYQRAVDEADVEVKKGLTQRGQVCVVRNAHWECLDCGDSWKVPRDSVPRRCREYSVARDGRPTNKPGCGSSNIRRKENVGRNDEGDQTRAMLEDVMGGTPALVSGKQLKPIIDWDMGENDVEGEVRPERRELAINGRHAAFREADRLDGNETAEGASFDDLRATRALTVHVINAASFAWGAWHCRQSKGNFDVFQSEASRLKQACLGRV